MKEYECQLQQLRDENKEKDQSFQAFMREMNELLQVHEKNSKLFLT